MNLFINAVKRAEENAREREELGFEGVKANWVNHLPDFLMKAELMALIKEEARATLFRNEPHVFRNYTPCVRSCADQLN